LRRFAHGRDVLFLFPTELRFDVARDRFGNVRFVREVRQ
jgi:hypothetical protein